MAQNMNEESKLAQLLQEHPELAKLSTSDADIYAWLKQCEMGRCTVEEALIGALVHMAASKAKLNDQYLNYMKGDTRPIELPVGGLAAGRTFRQFQNFVNCTRNGARIQLHGVTYVALDRKQFDELVKKADPPQVFFNSTERYEVKE